MTAFKTNPQGAPGGGGDAHARSPRRRVLLNGMFLSLSGSYPASVRNLSCTGASIECDGPLKVGGEGVIQANQLDAFCRIVWSKGPIHGLAFDQPLPNALVLQLHRVTDEDVRRARSIETKEWFDLRAR